MNDAMRTAAPMAPMPVWLDWVLSNTQSGLIVLDSQAQLVYANKWFISRSRQEGTAMAGRPLLETFPELQDSHFMRALQQAMRSGFPALLSQTLHPAPFPLFEPSAQHVATRRLNQSIHIVPMGPRDAALAGQRYTLVQISDVSHVVARERVLKAQTEKLNDMVLTDALTGIGNRRFFDGALPAEIRSAARQGAPLGLLLLDIDNFKVFNDSFGHQAGDRCLRAVAQVVKAVCRRPRDLVARYGGEELAVILPDTDLQGTLRVAGEILQATRVLRMAPSEAAGVVTLSAGAAAQAAEAKALEDGGAGLLRQADQALYAAKQAGRDRCYYFDGQGLVAA